MKNEKENKFFKDKQGRTCDGCGAKCCKSVVLDQGHMNPFIVDNMKWLAAHKNISIAIDSKQNYAVVINEECQYLENDLCSIHDNPNRFKVCQDFGFDVCSRYNEQDGVILNSPQEIEDYLNVPKQQRLDNEDKN